MKGETFRRGHFKVAAHEDGKLSDKRWHVYSDHEHESSLVSLMVNSHIKR